jgi:hypothetical protein
VEVGELPPRGAGLYLAAHSVVFIGHWLPHDLLTQWEDIFDDQIQNGLSSIWPPSAEIVWPTPDIPEEFIPDKWSGRACRLQDTRRLRLMQFWPHT